ncbi:MAG: UvrD-helicase domain-containing protein [Coriobacteriia bacterium]|nr:UvrD-helicase domain-containing protein [Coriobacteriia bacterium]
MSELNADQLTAAATLEGGLLISAGAGTGKTRTLAERFVNAVREGAVEGWEPAAVDELLTITFTEKAAGEIEERVRSTLRTVGLESKARRLDSAWISTIHGYCSRVLRQYALEAGLAPGFIVIDGAESGLMRERAFRCAAQESLDGGTGAELFSNWDYAAIFRAAEGVAHSLSVAGLDPGSLATEPTLGVESLFDAAEELFMAGREELLTCGDQKSTLDHVARCEDTLGTLRAVRAQDLDEPTRALELWELLVAYGSKGRSSKAAQGAVAALIEERDRIAREAAAVALSPVSQALCSLVESYVENYRRLKQEAGVVDFDDLQLGIRTLLAGNPQVAEELASRFRLTMVDEFQDTDELQLSVIRAVAGLNLCTVGDEQQSIYRFRGADIDVYRAHNRDVVESGGHVVELAENYRSHKDILRFVGDAFEHEILFGSRARRLKPGRTEPASPFVPPDEPRIDLVLVNQQGKTRSSSRRTEAQAVADRFARLRDEFGVRASEMVVLLRSYGPSDYYAQALRGQGFDVVVVGGSRFFHLPEIEMMRCLLRVLVNPLDDEALLIFALSLAGGLDDDTLVKLRFTHEGERIGASLWESMQAAEGLDGEPASRVGAVVAAVEEARGAIGQLSLAEILMTVLERTDGDLAILANAETGPDAFANVLKLLRMVHDWEHGGGAGPAAFAAFLNAKERLGEYEAPAILADDQTEAIRIMSIHAAKGLEFPVVAVPELGFQHNGDREFARTVRDEAGIVVTVRMPVAGLPPALAPLARTPMFVRASEGDKAAEAAEARRLFYVACTRAREALILTGSGNAASVGSSDSPLNWLRAVFPQAYDAQPGQSRRVEIGSGIFVGTQTLEAHETDRASSEEPSGESRLKRGDTVDDDAVRRGQDARSVPGATPTRGTLSYSRIAAFEQCALQYAVAYELGAGSALEDSGDGRRFGTALHLTLQLAGESGSRPDASRIAAIGRQAGISSVDVSRLTSVLDTFLDSDIGRRVMRGPSRFEYPFAIRLGGRGGVVLQGSMDAYTREGDEALVVDYKAGSAVLSPDGRARHELQAKCYAIAALQEGCRSVEVTFVRLGATASSPGHADVTFGFTWQDSESIERSLAEKAEKIRTSERAPLPEWDERVCRGCLAAGNVCPLPVPNRPRGARR